MNGSCRLPFCGPPDQAEEVDENAVFDVSRLMIMMMIIMMIMVMIMMMIMMIMMMMMMMMQEAGHNNKGITNCVFSSCAGIQFNSESNRELKLHYTNVHYKKYFPLDPKTRLSPGFVKVSCQ